MARARSTPPEPMTPPECDLRGYEYMPLFGQRLFGSDLYAESSDEEFRAALKLWWEAWQQCPAGSLPAGDHALARLADYGRDLERWAKIKTAALHGFVLCADGRLYHPMLCEAALKAYELRLKSDRKRETDRRRLQAWREARRARSEEEGSTGSGNSLDTHPETPEATRVETPDETRFDTQTETPSDTRFETPVVGGRREGKGSEDKEVSNLPPTAAPDEPPPGARTALFRDGLQLVRHMTGRPDKPARKLVGKMLEHMDDDACLVHQVIRDAADLRPADPVAWMMAASGAKHRSTSAAKITRDWGLHSFASPEALAAVEGA